MARSKPHRSSTEIKEVATDKTVILTAADWTDDEKRLAVTQGAL